MTVSITEVPSFCSRLRGMVLLLIVLLAGTIRPLASSAQYHLMTQDAVLPYIKNTILKAHADADPNATAQQIAAADQHLMLADPLPAVQSVRYGIVLMAAEKYYEQQRFAEAATQLKAAVAGEPDNSFLLYQYARALYPTENTKPQSFIAYQQLVRKLDHENGENDSTATIDYWFLEAYWKLATLQMDQAQWSPAAYNISRFLIGASSLGDLSRETQLYEEALSYLTECYFMLNEPEICRYYGARTLKFFPKNQYVRAYLAKLPPPTKSKLKP